MSEIGDLCKTVAKKAMDMKSPCIQITPVFPNYKNEWATLYYYFLNVKKNIEDRIKLPILIDIKESSLHKVVCKNVCHEYVDMNTENHIICIHCGDIAIKRKGSISAT